MAKLNVLVAGCTGYIGIQLIKLLINHKRVKIKYLCGNSSVGKKISFFDKSIKKKLPKITKFNNNINQTYIDQHLAILTNQSKNLCKVEDAKNTISDALKTAWNWEKQLSKNYQK